MRRRRVVVVLLLLALAGFAGSAAGCGYTVATRMTDPGGAKTVAISTFANKTWPPRPGLEIHLHDEVIAAIHPGPYRLAPRHNADLIVTGELVSFEQSTLSQRTDLTPSEIRLTVGVKMSVRQVRPVLREWTDVIEPVSETFADATETLQEAQGRAFRRLARSIIERFAPPGRRWDEGPR
jgi:hypothetical protein